MVKLRVSAAILVAGVLSAAPASARCTKGSESEPPLCRLTIPPIASIFILENGAKSSLEGAAAVDCSDFVLTERQVRNYLSRAKRVPSNSGHSALDWSACYASGTATFRGGKSARWMISQLRVGSLILDGQEETLYCPMCKDKPFAW